MQFSVTGQLLSVQEKNHRQNQLKKHPQNPQTAEAQTLDFWQVQVSLGKMVEPDRITNKLTTSQILELSIILKLAFNEPNL